MRPLVNPGMPTPLGFGYYLPNLSTGKAVEFDDCQQTTGRMIDYKDRYWKTLSDLDIQKFFIKQLWSGRSKRLATDRCVGISLRRRRQTSSATYLKATLFEAALKSFTYQCRRARDE